MLKIASIIGGVILLGLLAWFVISLVDREPVTPLNVPSDGQVTLVGKVVCLPHRNTEGSQTLECAYGLLGNDENYYGVTDVDSSAGIGAITQYAVDTEVEVAGIFTLGEDERYATVGTIEIETITAVGEVAVIQTTSDGVIRFSQPEDFGLAVTSEQVPEGGIIPPCTNEFSYCLYHDGATYENTNFISAGVSIKKRADLPTAPACLTTQPEGYTGLSVSTSTGEGYAMSLFGPLDDAAAGSYSTGEDYRLFASSTCYEFVTRVGESQFTNYPAGIITEFPVTERESLLAVLRGIVNSVILEATGQKVTVPEGV